MSADSAEPVAATDGSPLGGVHVTLGGTDSSALTDSGGLARLRIVRARYLTATKGTDVALLPADVRISVHGDSEFRSHELFEWLRGQGYDAMLGIRAQMWVYDTADPRADGQPLAARVAALPPQTATGRKRKHRTSPIT